MSVKTAEAVYIGHPDKLCDLIAETILDDVTRDDPAARVAVEVAIKGRHVYVFGEITTVSRLSVRASVVFALQKAGYAAWRFFIHLNLSKQSPEIASGVNQSVEARDGEDTAFALLGAGDQGTVYGYANSENSKMLPTPLVIAHKICKALDEARKTHLIAGRKPDGKAQVSVRYDDTTNTPVEVSAVVVSVQHESRKNLDTLRQEVLSFIVKPALGDLPLAADAVVLINPAGSFVKGGPAADAGLTGRKLAVDTYGGLGAHGGGAFAGKEMSKVDRTGALMARRIAKTIIDAGAASEVTVAISYAIGKADPVAFNINTHGTGTIPDTALTEICRGVFVLRPAAMIETLHLRVINFADYTTYGYFYFPVPWENQYAASNKLRKQVKEYASENPQNK